MRHKPLHVLPLSLGEARVLACMLILFLDILPLKQNISIDSNNNDILSLVI